MTRRRCSFCRERARYEYDPRDGTSTTPTAMCPWHVLLFYLGFDLEWRS